MSLIATITPMDYNTDNIEKIRLLREYARKAVHHGLYDTDGNSPYHGDLIYHQVFNYLTNPHEQSLYKAVPLAWQKDSKEIHIYSDLGINPNMIEQVKAIQSYNPNIPIRFLSLNNDRKLEQETKEIFRNFLILDDKHLPIDETTPSVKDIFQINQSYGLDYHFEPKTIGGLITEPPFTTDFVDLKPVILESPFAGDVKNNVFYAKMVINELARQGYAPTASHLLFTQMLDDTREDHRKLGIDRGLDIAHNKDSIIAIDRGISGGMVYGIKRAENEGRNVSFTTLSNDKDIQHEVSFLRDLKDAEEYCNMVKRHNQNLFDKTGYIIEVPNTPSTQQNKPKK